MDAGWAVVAGAAIALVGSIIAPWLRDSFERRHRRNEGLRDAIANSLRRVSAAMSELASATDGIRRLDSSEVVDKASPAYVQFVLKFGAASTEMEQAIFELGLLLDRKNASIETVSRMMSDGIRNPDYGVEMAIYTTVVSRWYRGEISAKGALRDYTSTLRDFDRDPFSGLPDLIVRKVARSNVR